jgi:phosphoribosyl-ATP pyrophosphohydrolase
LGSEVLTEVFKVIENRRDRPKLNSYVSGLMSVGLDRVLEKVEEESRELIVAARKEPRSNIIHEAADLIFHVMVLLAAKNIEMEEVFRELQKRRK